MTSRQGVGRVLRRRIAGTDCRCDSALRPTARTIQPKHSARHNRYAQQPAGAERNTQSGCPAADHDQVELLCHHAPVHDDRSSRILLMLTERRHGKCAGRHILASCGRRMSKGAVKGQILFGAVGIDQIQRMRILSPRTAAVKSA